MKPLIFVLFSILCSGQGILNPILGTPPPVTGCSLSFTTGLQAWYKADAGVTCVTMCASGIAVTAWADQSGNGNTLTRVAGTALFFSALLNGHPGIQADGIASDFTFATPINLQGSDNSMFIVAQLRTTGGLPQPVVSGGNATGAYEYRIGSGGGSLQETVKSQTAVLLNGTITEDTNPHQFNIIFHDSGATAARQNETDDGSATPNTSITANETDVFAGSGVFFGGNVAEILIYNSALSTTNRNTVETYLNCRYGL